MVGMIEKFPNEIDLSETLKRALRDPNIEARSNERGQTLLIFSEAATDEEMRERITEIQPERPYFLDRMISGEVRRASIGGNDALIVPDQTLSDFEKRALACELAA